MEERELTEFTVGVFKGLIKKGKLPDDTIIGIAVDGEKGKAIGICRSSAYRLGNGQKILLLYLSPPDAPTEKIGE